MKLFRGWPIPANLDTDMAAGTVDVSIFPTRVETNATRYGKGYQALPLPAPTLTLTASGDRLTVGGTVEVPQNVAALVKTAAGTFGCSYGVQANNTLASIATGLAALINADTPATSSGPVITIPAAILLTPRIGVVGTAVQELKRQRRNVMVSIWCPTPDLRDNAAKLLDPALAQNEFLTMPDGTACRLIYVGSPVTDSVQKENIYRRDLIYSAEYGTTVSIAAPTVTVEEIAISGGQDPTGPVFETLYP
ncbi:MAG: hypothetical protein WAL34_03995 [Acidobacteriaceae bacterium]